MIENEIYDKPNLDYFNNYSTDPWPRFEVPGMDCTANGEEIIFKQGQWYKDNYPLPFPVNVLANNNSRDNVTGHKFLEGLGIEVNGDMFTINPEPFEWNKTAPECQISTQETIDILNSQMQRYPKPDNFDSLVAKIFGIAGPGAAGDWTASPCAPCNATAIEDHYWAPICGGCQVADSFSTRFMMQWGALQEIAWGGLSTSEIPELLAIHTWYLMVAMNSYEENRIKASSIAWAILDALDAGAEGTTIFMGHDLQMGGLSGALGLSWDPSPWAVNNTTPGSGLRFDMDSDSDAINITYIWVNNYTSVEVKTVPITFPGESAPGVASLHSLRELVQSKTVEACSTYRATAPSGGGDAASYTAADLVL